MKDTFDTLLKERRAFSPPKDFPHPPDIRSLQAYQEQWRHAKDDPEGFWSLQAKKFLDWQKDFDRVLEWNRPFAQWFLGGQLNASENCLDRHLAQRGNKTAIIWEGEGGQVRHVTYRELFHDVCRLANGLKKLGTKTGDRITIYMPMVPELAIAVLACARIGATHNVVFGGFSASAIAERNRDANARFVITADGGMRNGKMVPLKREVDLACDASPSVEKVIVYPHLKTDTSLNKDRDIGWHDLCENVSDICPPEPLDSEHPLFVLYTSGSTGKPKGILHTTGGYLLGATISSRYVLDLSPEKNDVYWCTADVGWITGHSYVIYGPLANGATILMYEGGPMHPIPDRFWSIIARHRVNIFYTAPTAIRAFMKQGIHWPQQHDLSSLRLLGTVGEPINPEAWMWYRENIGNDRCPIVDTWWQTETGSIMIAPLPGVTPTAPGSATRPFFGVVPDIVDPDGNPVPDGVGGYLVLRQPWPSMLRTILNDENRYKETYWGKFQDCYFTGDGARRDKDGNYWIMGRVDDVLNVSGHRLSTMEIESALVSHPAIAEAAVVGKPHDVRGESVCAFVILEKSFRPSDELRSELCQHVTRGIGSIARPEELRFSESLPKTRSGKIMRRLLRDIAAGRQTSGDVTTLEEVSVLEKLRTSETGNSEGVL